MSSFNNRLRCNMQGVTKTQTRRPVRHRQETEKAKGVAAMPGKNGCRLCDFTGHKPGDTERLSAPAPLHPALMLKRKRSMGMPLEVPVSYRIISWLRCTNCKGRRGEQ